MSERTEAWYHLRASRANPPGSAKIGDGRLTYQAALQQSEELWLAARAAGPAGCPVPLFYFLAQAGRAIVAARGDTGAKCHGLEDPVLGDSVLGCLVQPGRNGWYQKLLKVTDSAHLPPQTELGALMASIPELADLDGIDQRWPQAIPVWPVSFAVDPLTSGFQHITSTDQVPGAVVLPDLPNDLEGVQAALNLYPDASAAEPSLQCWDTSRGRGYLVRWLRTDPSTDPLPPRYGGEGFRWMRPNFPSGDPPPSILMTWWAILFTLSMLARYHPVEWVAALDVNRSPEAVVLERAVEVALEVVPELVLEAIEAADRRDAGG
ncbi:MAG: YaaC family protein [Candidatus Dormibacteria bacterium]